MYPTINTMAKQLEDLWATPNQRSLHDAVVQWKATPSWRLITCKFGQSKENSARHETGFLTKQLISNSPSVTRKNS